MRKPIFFPLVAALFLVAGCGGNDDDTRPAAAGLVTVASTRNVDSTFAALDAALTAAPPVTVIARVDHAANAPADMPLRPTRVILFGNPTLGTPLMQANQVAGIDLPQKFLVYQDAEGRTGIGYNGTDYLAARHGVGGVATLANIGAALKMFAENAAGQAVANVATGTVGLSEGLVVVRSNADAAGSTFVVYNDPAFLARRHGATGVDGVVATIRTALSRLAATAAGQ